LTWEQTEKLVTLALEENPFEIIKKEFGLVEKRSSENEKKDAS
jgi:hypothetical protein